MKPMQMTPKPMAMSAPPENQDADMAADNAQIMKNLPKVVGPKKVAKTKKPNPKKIKSLADLRQASADMSAANPIKGSKIAY